MRYLKESIGTFFVFLMLSFVVYWRYIFYMTLNIDGEFSNNFLQTISLGRWFHALLKLWLLPEPFLPIFTPILAIFFLCMAGVLLGKIYNCKPGEKIIVFLLFISFPQFSYQLEFLNQADTFCIGVLLCMFSAYLLIKKYKLGVIYSSLMLMCALGIYQTLILVIPTVVLIYCALEIWKNNNVNMRDIFQLCLRAFFVTFISIVLYFIVQISFKKYFAINADGYLFSYLAFKNNIYDYIASVYSGVVDFILGKKFLGEKTFLLVSIGYVFLLCNIIFKYNKSKVIAFVFTSLSLLATLSLIFLSGNSSPPRLFVTCSLLMVLAYLSCRYVFPFKNLINFIAIVVILFNILTINTLFYKDYLVRRSDLDIANKISFLLRENNKSCNGVKMYIHGRLDGINNLGTSADTFGKSFFWWDGGNYMRAIAFMKYYKVCSAIPAGKDDVKYLASYIEDMPKWPDKNSVKVIDNIVVIKMSDNFGWLPFSIN